jgi:hypothetical protein
MAPALLGDHPKAAIDDQVKSGIARRLTESRLAKLSLLLGRVSTAHPIGLILVLALRVIVAQS